MQMDFIHKNEDIVIKKLCSPRYVPVGVFS